MTKEQFEVENNKFWGHISLHSKDESLIILKEHLLLEDLMREFCSCKVESKNYLQNAQLGFNQILGLTRAFDATKNNEWVWAGLKKVNSLRNMLAHNLSPIDFDKKRNQFINYIETNASFKPDYYESTPEFQILAFSIFNLYTTLSSTLKYKPDHSLLAQALINRNSGK